VQGMEHGLLGRLVPGGATLVVALAAGFAVQDQLPHTPAAASIRAVGRPNIVLIQTDDQTYKQLTRRAMPNTKRLLARRGTRFTDYIASTAQCCPSRASLITGQYAHNHGVTSNNVGYPGLVDKGNVLPVWLRRAGYRTIHVGKFLNGYERSVEPDSVVPPGWDEWHTVLGSREYYRYNLFVNGRVIHYGHRRRDNITRVLNRAAVTLIKRYVEHPRPLYLQLDARAPHDSRERDPFGRCGREPIPEARDRKVFQRAPLPRPPSYNEQDISDKPPFISAAPRLGPAETQEIRKHWRCALGSLRGVDRGVGEVFRAVRAAGELRRTVFIFTSDNGQFYGEHRLKTGKVLPYEEALRLLAADAASAPFFEKVLRDKDEMRENRQIAASALRALNPDKFQKHAREMLLDKSEYEDIQATSLTALGQFGDDEAVAKDTALLKSVDRLSDKAKSAKYKRSAKQFLGKYRP